MKDFFKDQFFKALEKNTIFSRADVQGNLIFVSDKLCQISGYSKKELIGKKHSIFKHPDVEECCRRKNKISIWKNKTSIKVEILFFYKP